MGISKTGLYGNDYIGAFSITNDSVTLVGGSPGGSGETVIRENLKTRIVETLINGSDLLGIYSVLNSRALLLPPMTYKTELDRLKAELPELEVSIFETDLNALRNNILANDKVAIVNPRHSASEVKALEDLLGVEIIKMQIGGFETVGANNILTNRGLVMNNRVSEEEESMLKELFKNVSQSTANTGSVSIGLCTIANSNGIVAGNATTGYELSNMAEGLDLG